LGYFIDGHIVLSIPFAELHKAYVYGFGGGGGGGGVNL
jgi:hypothetical protein